MTSGKSLTQPPKDLKEAIDWVIQIKNDINTEDLAKALEELLKRDGSEVAMKVLESYRLASQSAIDKLVDANSKMKNLNDRFYFTYTALNKLSEGLKPFNPQSDANISPKDVENVKAWVSSVDGNNLQKRIETFADGLKTFQNGIIQNPSNSAYSNLDWSSLTDSDKRERAAILLGIMPVVYIGLTYLYWQCSGPNVWQHQKLDGSGGSGSDQGSLKQYIAALGYGKTDLNNSKRGQDIATQLKSAFSKELEKAYNTAQPKPPPSTSPSYPEFLSELQKPLESKPPQPPTLSPHSTSLVTTTSLISSTS
ncbi:variant erythrocyte surface antigen-1 family protein [Babesia caballi]|uniref:Variant erythrocyte surface antigen-1 family protein n=1 Tax=Babesia caballi TaxID=5871 RepID=A0AAV4LR84_BABCB|nr:variant erythrocyte surface antigen-1 family protein [Babesia caballi]